MPLAAAASKRTFEPASVPHVRIVFTPSALRLATCCGKSAGAGPHVTPLIGQFLPLTRRAQLPCEPATRTLPSAGPVVPSPGSPPVLPPPPPLPGSVPVV